MAFTHGQAADAVMGVGKIWIETYSLIGCAMRELSLGDYSN